LPELMPTFKKQTNFDTLDESRVRGLAELILPLTCYEDLHEDNWKYVVLLNKNKKGKLEMVSTLAIVRDDDCFKKACAIASKEIFKKLESTDEIKTIKKAGDFPKSVLVDLLELKNKEFKRLFHAKQTT
jgi:hypothetical protein